MNQNKVLTVSRQFRKLEDLDLLDNFLFQEMLSQEEGEEFVRILLSTILDKEIRKVRIIPQKNILGTDTDRHGIRLDAYIEDLSDKSEDAADVEVIPDIYDVEPNKTYEKDTLPRRMVYTIQNSCKEVPSLAYDDGARKIFLYTKGKDRINL